MATRLMLALTVLLSLVALPGVGAPPADMDELREAAARSVAAWVDEKQPGVGRMLAVEIGVTEEVGNRIISLMRLDQARCSINSWHRVPDDLEAFHLRRLSAGIRQSEDPTEYGAAIVQSMIDRGYSESELRDINEWADDYYKSCIREGERLYMQRIDQARRSR